MKKAERIRKIMAGTRPVHPQNRVKHMVVITMQIRQVLWALWAVYKENIGIPFGEYTLIMYRYAKDFYRAAKELMEAETEHPGTEEFSRLRTRLQKALNIYAMFFKQAEFAPENEYRVAFRNPDRRRICFREKDGFLLPYIEIDLSGSGCLPAARVTVAPKNHVDLAKKGMVQYLAHMNIKAEVVLSELKLRY